MSLEVEFQVGAHTYRAARMSAFAQMDIASDYRDILVGLALTKQERAKMAKLAASGAKDATGAPYASVSDADYQKAVEFILTSRVADREVRHRVQNQCLATVVRKDTAWAPVLAGDDNLAFADIDPSAICQILYKVFEYNKLLDFFSDAPSASAPVTETGQG